MKRNTKPTIRHKRLMTEMLSGKHTSKKSALKAAGFSDATSTIPHTIFDSKGFKQLIADTGLDEQFLLTCLKEDIIAKPKDRARELEMAFKLNDSFPTQKIEIDVFATYSDEELSNHLASQLNSLNMSYDPKTGAFTTNKPTLGEKPVRAISEGSEGSPKEGKEA